MNPDLHPDLTVVLLGKTGVGKSASGNTILGRTAFKSENALKSVTEEISEQKGNVFGKQISVVDTPGILDSKDTEEKIESCCQELLQSSRRCLFLVVLRAGRITKEDQKAVKAAERVLGPRGLKESYLLLTGGDALKDKTLDDFIFQDEGEDTLPDVVKRFAGACHLFNNEVDNEEQVRELLLKSGHLPTHQQPDLPADVFRDRRVMLFGLPGSGKSASGNTMLGSDQFESDGGLDSVTMETVSKSAVVEGRKVTVVDHKDDKDHNDHKDGTRAGTRGAVAGAVVRVLTGAVAVAVAVVRVLAGAVMRVLAGAVAVAVVRVLAGAVLSVLAGAVLSVLAGAVLSVLAGAVMRVPTEAVMRVPTEAVMRVPTEAVMRVPTEVVAVVAVAVAVAVVRVLVGAVKGAVAVVRVLAGALAGSVKGALAGSVKGAVMSVLAGAVMSVLAVAVMRVLTGVVAVAVAIAVVSVLAGAVALVVSGR